MSALGTKEELIWPSHILQTTNEKVPWKNISQGQGSFPLTTEQEPVACPSASQFWTHLLIAAVPADMNEDLRKMFLCGRLVDLLSTKADEGKALPALQRYLWQPNPPLTLKPLAKLCQHFISNNIA